MSDKFIDQIKEAVKIAKFKVKESHLFEYTTHSNLIFIVVINPKKKAGGSFGYLTTVAAMQPCQKMQLSLQR